MSTDNTIWDSDGFWTAVDTEDVETIERFFKEDDTLASCIELDQAVAQNSVKSTRCVLEHGVDINATEDSGFAIPVVRPPPTNNTTTATPSKDSQDPNAAHHRPDHFDHSLRILNRAAEQGMIAMFDQLVEALLALGAEPVDDAVALDAMGRGTVSVLGLLLKADGRATTWLGLCGRA